MGKSVASIGAYASREGGREVARACIQVIGRRTGCAGGEVCLAIGTVGSGTRLHEPVCIVGTIRRAELCRQNALIINQ